MTYIRRAAVARVTLGNPGLEYELAADGFGGPLVWVGRALREGSAYASLLTDLSGVSAQIARSSCRMIAIDDQHDGVVLPLEVNVNTALGATDYILTQSGDDGDWVELTADIGASKWIWHTGASPQVVTAETQFDLPQDCPFLVSIWRAGITDDFDLTDCFPTTELHFGVTSGSDWCIALPYGEKATLCRYYPDFAWYDSDTGEVTAQGRYIEAPGGQLDLGTGSSASREECFNIMVWPLGDRFLISSLEAIGSDMGGKSKIYRWPGEAIYTAAGPIRLLHNAGQWAFRFVPLTAPSGCTIIGPQIALGYDKTVNANTIQTGYYSGGYGVIAVTDGSAIVPACGNGHVRWQVALTRNRTTESYTKTGETDMSTIALDRSPILYSVQLWQIADIDAKTPGSADISADVKSATVEAAFDVVGRSCTLEIDNEPQRGHSGMAAARDVDVDLAWYEEEVGGTGTQVTYSNVFKGQTIVPEESLEAGQTHGISLTCVDNATKLAAGKADGRVPVFDNWLVTDILEWVLARCNIPAAYRVLGTDIENLALRVSEAMPDSVTWVVEPGRSWLEFLTEDLLKKAGGNGALWIAADGHVQVGCRYCRTLRSSDPDSANFWAYHDGWASTGCLAADVTRAGATGVDYTIFAEPSSAPAAQQANGPGEVLRVSRKHEPIDPDGYANAVVVMSEPVDGFSPVRAAYYDANSIAYTVGDPSAYMGYLSHKIITLPDGMTQADANRIAWEEFQKIGQRPLWLNGTIALLPALDLGMVVKTVGVSDIGIEDCHWRVAKVTHRAHREGQWPTTEILGRYIGSD